MQANPKVDSKFAFFSIIYLLLSPETESIEVIDLAGNGCKKKYCTLLIDLSLAIAGGEIQSAAKADERQQQQWWRGPDGCKQPQSGKPAQGFVYGSAFLLLNAGPLRVVGSNAKLSIV